MLERKLRGGEKKSAAFNALELDMQLNRDVGFLNSRFSEGVYAVTPTGIAIFKVDFADILARYAGKIKIYDEMPIVQRVTK